MLQDIYNDPNEMALFSYELRVFDAEQAIKNNKPEYYNKYTKKFLDYGVFTSPIWQAILTSNQWTKAPGDDEFRMIVDPRVCFKMNLGKFIFRCQDANFPIKHGVKESPFVVNIPEKDVVNDIQDSKGFWGKIKAFLDAKNKQEWIDTYW